MIEIRRRSLWLVAAALATPFAWFLPVYLTLRHNTGRYGGGPAWGWMGLYVVTLPGLQWLYGRAKTSS